MCLCGCMAVFVPAAVHVCVSDVTGQQESEEEEELCKDPGDVEEDTSGEDYEDCMKNEDEEARGRSPTSLNSETSFSMTVEVMQGGQSLQPWTPPDVSSAHDHSFHHMVHSFSTI